MIIARVMRREDTIFEGSQKVGLLSFSYTLCHSYALKDDLNNFLIFDLVGRSMENIFYLLIAFIY